MDKIKFKPFLAFAKVLMAWQENAETNRKTKIKFNAVEFVYKHGKQKRWALVTPTTYWGYHIREGADEKFKVCAGHYGMDVGNELVSFDTLKEAKEYVLVLFAMKKE
jgi:hypothetical protein